MPGRPPGPWMRSCVRGVRASGSAASPGAVCGALWYRKMTPAGKRRALASERNVKENRAMAHKKTHHKSRALALYRPSAPKPIVIRTTKVVKAKKHHHRRHGGGGGLSLGGLFSKQRMGIVAGALAFGFLEKQAMFQSLPSLPLIGKSGTIGLGAYLLSNGGRNKLADDIATAALVIAAHELGSTGTIVGEHGDGTGIGYVAGY